MPEDVYIRLYDEKGVAVAYDRVPAYKPGISYSGWARRAQKKLDALAARFASGVTGSIEDHCKFKIDANRLSQALPIGKDS